MPRLLQSCAGWQSAPVFAHGCSRNMRAGSLQGCIKAVRAGSPPRHFSGRAASPAFERQGCFKAVRASSPHRHMRARAASKPCGLAARTRISAPGLLQSETGRQPAPAFQCQGLCFKSMRAGSPHRHLSTRAALKPCGLAAHSCIGAPGRLQSRAGWQPAPAFEGQGCFEAVRAGGV